MKLTISIVFLDWNMSNEGSPRENSMDGLESSMRKSCEFFFLLFLVDLADQPMSAMDAGSIDTQGKSKGIFHG